MLDDKFTPWLRDLTNAADKSCRWWWQRSTSAGRERCWLTCWISRRWSKLRPRAASPSRSWSGESRTLKCPQNKTHFAECVLLILSLSLQFPPVFRDSPPAMLHCSRNGERQVDGHRSADWRPDLSGSGTCWMSHAFIFEIKINKTHLLLFLVVLFALRVKQ